MIRNKMLLIYINCNYMCSPINILILPIFLLIWIYVSLSICLLRIRFRKIIDDVTPAGYSFDHATRIYKKGGESAFFSVIIWSVKPICAFRLILLKIINWHLYPGDEYSCSFYLKITTDKWPESCIFLQGSFVICWPSHN